MLGVDLDGTRRIQKDRLDDHWDDQGARLVRDLLALGCPHRTFRHLRDCPGLWLGFGLAHPGAYESDGVEDALVLLVERSRRQAVPATLVRLPDRELRLGVGEDATGWPSWSLTWRPWSGCARAVTLIRPDFGWTALIPRTVTCSASQAATALWVQTPATQQTTHQLGNAAGGRAGSSARLQPVT